MKLFFAHIILFFSFFHQAQKINRFNSKGERTGKWVTYTDASHTKRVSELKYRKGEVVGTGYYYTMEGVLERKEKKKRKRIKITFYQNGTKVPFSKGNARIDITPEKVHYYFYGKWKYYDQNGKLEKYIYYNKGIQGKIEYVGKKKDFNDSLSGLLLVIDQDFRSKFSSLVDSVNLAWWNPKLAESYRDKIYYSDTALFNNIERVLGKFGYPSVEVCGELATVVPFYIINHATISVREKYVELFRAAAGTGKLKPSSLAYYIDKIKVAKGEEQVYGTQFYYTKDKKYVNYPSIDPKNLNARRKEMGLDPIEE